MVGAYAHDFDQNQIENVVQWMTELRKTPELAGFLFVILSEVNYGTLSVDIAKHIRHRIYNCTLLDQNLFIQNSSFGAHTTNESKYKWSREFRVAIFEDNIIRIWKYALIDSPRLNNSISMFWEEYILQLENYVEVPAPVLPLKRGARRGLPQLMSKTQNIKDDLVICSSYLTPLLRLRCDPEAWPLMISNYNRNYHPPERVTAKPPPHPKSVGEQENILHRALHKTIMFHLLT